MDEIKGTSKLDIKKKLKELTDIKEGLEFLLKNHSTIAGTLKITFSNDCIECGRNAQFIKNARDIFISDISNVVKLYNCLNQLMDDIVPNTTYPHWDDYNDDGTKPVLDETYDPLK